MNHVELNGKSSQVTYTTLLHGNGKCIISAFGITGHGDNTEQARADFERKFKLAGGTVVNCSGSYNNGRTRAEQEIFNRYPMLNGASNSNKKPGLGAIAKEIAGTVLDTVAKVVEV